MEGPGSKRGGGALSFKGKGGKGSKIALTIICSIYMVSRTLLAFRI